MAAVAVVLVALAVVAGVVVSNKQDEKAARDDATSTTARRATTTTIPRITDASALAGYCSSPGAKWNEVAPHVPAEPSRSNVTVDHGAARPNGFDGSGMDTAARGGSTVISPHTDGRFTDDPSVLARSRSVTCVRYVRTDTIGRQCDYGNDNFGLSGSRYTLGVARNVYEVTVYELHSGGILHKGEVWSRTPSGCPDHAYVERTSTVSYPLTDGDVLAWLGSHFVDGKPS